MARMPTRAAVYAAADDWKQRCLLADGSVLSDEALWTAEHTAELVAYFVESPDYSKRSFEAKLEDQLSHASMGARQLCAEMLWVMMLFPSNIKQGTKTALVRKVWGWSGAPLSDPRRMLEVFSNGIGSGGPGYNNYRPIELQLLVQFTAAMKALDVHERQRLLSEAWAFADWFDRFPMARSRQLRHMLYHLLFPEEF
jgi:5-methylcytosine-specific restriction protein B